MTIARLFATQCEQGLFKWTDVMMYWRTDVMRLIVEDGYKLNADGTCTKLNN